MRSSAALVVVVGALAAAAVPAAAQAQAPPTLVGESLNDVDFGPGAFDPDRARCSAEPDGSTVLMFQVSGLATGPYPGTFTETATVTISPQVEVDPGPVDRAGLLVGRVIDFSAEFEIRSGDYVITGTKAFAPEGIFSNFLFERALCAEFSDRPFGPFEHAEGHVVEFGTWSRYTATITGPDGTFTRTGLSDVVGQNIEARALPPEGGGQGAQGFVEGFRTEDVVAPPSAVVLTPPTAVNTVGTSHTVTATVGAAGEARSGYAVDFSVAGSVSTSGSCTTDAEGRCTFTYDGPLFPGADLITACADGNRDGDIDPGEPCGEATKIWILPVATPGQVTGGGWIFKPASVEMVSFGFNAQKTRTGLNGNCNVIDHETNAQIRCLSVDSLVIVGTHATFFGHATFDGAVTDYRIDVDDLGEPGSTDTFKIQLDNGYAAAGVLAGGNIQIRP
jgi:hypothetical protein